MSENYIDYILLLYYYSTLTIIIITIDSYYYSYRCRVTSHSVAVTMIESHLRISTYMSHLLFALLCI